MMNKLFDFLCVWDRGLLFFCTGGGGGGGDIMAAHMG